MPDEIRQLFNEKSRDYDAQYADDESNNVFEKEKTFFERNKEAFTKYQPEKLHPIRTNRCKESA